MVGPIIGEADCGRQYTVFQAVVCVSTSRMYPKRRYFLVTSKESSTEGPGDNGHLKKEVWKDNLGSKCLILTSFT